MARLIDADNLVAELEELADSYADNLIKDIQTEIAISKHRYEDIGCRCFRRGMDHAIRIARQLPTIDPVKHRHWIHSSSTEHLTVSCSECGYKVNHFLSTWQTAKYCPNCGARMDGVEK